MGHGMSGFLTFKGPMWRAVDPEFSRRPLSPIGSMISGGRFNPVGIPAIYLASDPFTALLETNPYNEPIGRAMTLIPVELDTSGLADFTDPAICEALEVDRQRLDEPWSQVPGTSSYTQQIYHRIIGLGYAGIKFRSRANPYQFNIAMWIVRDYSQHAVTGECAYRTAGTGSVRYRSISEKLARRGNQDGMTVDSIIDEAISTLVKMTTRDPMHTAMSDAIMAASIACRGADGSLATISQPAIDELIRLTADLRPK